MSLQTASEKKCTEIREGLFTVPLMPPEQVRRIGNQCVACDEVALGKRETLLELQGGEAPGEASQPPGHLMDLTVSHRYYLGHLIIKLSSNPNITHQNLIVCAYDELKMLRDSSGETTALFIPIGNGTGGKRCLINAIQLEL